MSAFNTRTLKNSNMFVRTHVAFYFVSLLLSDILQGESSLTVQTSCPLLLDAIANISSSFRSHQFNHELGVAARRGRCIRLALYGARWTLWFIHVELANALSSCPQAHVGCRHCSLVSVLGHIRKLFNRFISGLWYGMIWLWYMELYSNLLQVIATRTFSVFFLRTDYVHYEKWIVLVAQWALIGAIVIGGPAMVKTEHGPYCEKLFDLQIFTDLITAFQMALWEIGVGLLQTILFSALCTYSRSRNP